MLSFFIWDFADIASEYNVVFKLHQHDVGKDVSAVASGVAVGDVKKLLNTKIVPHGVWELHEVGCG